MFLVKNISKTALVSILVALLTLTGCSSMPWSSNEDDEDLFFEEDFGSEFDLKSESENVPPGGKDEEDDFFKTDKELAQIKATSKSSPPPDKDNFFLDEEPKAQPKPSPKPAPVREPAVKIEQKSGVISAGGGGFVSVDQKTDKGEFKTDVAALHTQQAELMFRVQELQKIVNNLEPRLAATQERVESSLKASSTSPMMNAEIESLRSEVVQLKNEIAILKKAPARSKQTKLIQKSRPIRRYPKLSRTPKQYDLALAAYKAGKYDESILLFQELSLKNPPHNLKDNIVFWIGSNYMKLEMYDDAIKQFQTVQKKFPGGNKIHDARYMLGVCYQKKGDTGRALDTLELALKNNPPSSIRQKIEKHLMEIK